MSEEFIKIEKIITKRGYGLDWRDRLIQMSGLKLLADKQEAD